MSYAECRDCCSAASGSMYKVEDWADKHEEEKPGHKVKIEYEDDE